MNVQPYAGALEAVDRILNREPEADEVLRQAVAVVEDRVRTYRWVGLYFVEEQELVLGPRAGGEPVAGNRVQLEQGLLGTAVEKRRSEVRNDTAREDSRFPWTRSEIAVPVVYEGRTVGVLGVDSDRAGAFGPDDRSFLERVALLISAHCLVGWDTAGVPWSEVG